MDIVMFGFNDWHQWEAAGFRTRAGAIAKVLSEHPRVRHLLVVSNPHSLAINLVRTVRGSAGHALRPGTTLRPSALKRVTPKLAVLDHARLLPREAASELAFKVNGAVHDGSLRRSVRRASAALGMSDVVLWVSDPLMSKHLGRLGDSVAVFDAIDDWSAHPENRAMKDSILRGYERAREKADLIFTVSRSLQERLGGRERVYWQPNGVDVSRFEGERIRPNDLMGLARPVLGYVGVIQERLDVDGLLQLAVDLPEASIVLIGPVLSESHIRPLRAVSNIHLLGERHSREVPAYIDAFDVCLVPHVTDGLTQSMDPLKVYEYLAAGKPVVASGLANMDLPSGLMRANVESSEMSKAVLAALADEACDDRLATARREFAHTRSWTSRVNEMLGIITDFQGAEEAAR